MINFFQTFEQSNILHINVCSELFYSIEKILSECKAEELILPASYLVDFGATTKRDERFTEICKTCRKITGTGRQETLMKKRKGQGYFNNCLH